MEEKKTQIGGKNVEKCGKIPKEANDRETVNKLDNNYFPKRAEEN